MEGGEDGDGHFVTDVKKTDKSLVSDRVTADFLKENSSCHTNWHRVMYAVKKQIASFIKEWKCERCCKKHHAMQILQVPKTLEMIQSICNLYDSLEF